MSGSAESFMISICRPAAGLVFSPWLQPLLELFYHGPAVSVNDNRTVFDLFRAHGFIVIQAGIDSVFVVIRHLPERVFDNDWCVAADADLQEQDVQSVMPAKEIRVGR